MSLRSVVVALLIARQAYADVLAISPGTTSPSAAAAYAIGTRFSSPGTTCALDDGPALAEVQARVVGRRHLVCGTAESWVIIAPVIVATEVIAPLVREAATPIHVTVASVAALGERLDVEAIGELDLGDAQRTDGGFDITVTPRANATTVALRVVAGTLELGRVAVPLSDEVAPAPSAVPSRAAWFALDVGALGGLFEAANAGTRSAVHLGHPTRADDTLAGGGSIAAHLGFFPMRRVGLETQLALLSAGYAVGSGTATLLVERVQLAVRAVDDHRFGLRLLLGGDILTDLGHRGTSRRATDGGLHYGAAFTIAVADGLALRIEVMHMITTAVDASYAGSFLAQVGVVARFGRRDR